jgi:hypothetical protein
MANMNNKVCLNHTSVPATSRCTTCFKPICDECIHAEGSEHFCSQICIEKHKRTSENIELLKERKKPGLLGKVIKLLIIAAIVYGAWKYREPIKNLFDQSKKEISK